MTLPPAPEADLLRAIAEDPDDPAAYLVYADHLLQRGDPRGELIQLQLRLEALAPDDPAREPLTAREAELLRPLAAPWTELGATCGFRRGFLDLLDLPAVAFRAHTAASPAAADALAHLRRLELSWATSSGNARFTDADLAAVLALPALRRLEHLKIHGHRLGPPSGVALARADLPRLRSLRLSDAFVRDSTIAALVGAAPHLPSLESLTLTTNQLTDAAAEALAGWPHLARLRHLDLSSIDIYDPGCNSIGDRGATALVSSPGAGGLTYLDLGDNSGLSNATAFALAAAPHLTQLVHLGVAFTAIDDDGASALASSRSLARLESLRISHTGLTDAGLLAILRMPCLSSLEVSGARLTAAGIRALVEAPPRLTHLRAYVADPGLPDALRVAFFERFGPSDFFS